MHANKMGIVQSKFIPCRSIFYCYKNMYMYIKFKPKLEYKQYFWTVLFTLLE